MLKGFKDFLARGNIVDLSVAVVIGTAFTALVTSFTDSILRPLINRLGAGTDTEYGLLRISLGAGYDPIDLNQLLSGTINFLLVAAVVYFLIMLPYKRFRDRGEVAQAQDTQLTLLTEIRDLLADGHRTARDPHTADSTSADRDS
ncbi:large-conductance mechanosensitive channel protein MscL [Mycobacterium sp. MYCO198283]|uniref:large-conductance mechanosensitive channel protein MscL n=1 Tax=Mycobacterium sp. MYCO198283 TaxID=2883505 RepID=UPI001E55B643|nr:large-conductance mechanosensitive channel protein MscL [Mycobacterium sp. MYCO198283]MCG5430982.1 large-conductance mechanosensitive channel protein MscL [Mycobacterium sp. MYCO198283]